MISFSLHIDLVQMDELLHFLMKPELLGNISTKPLVCESEMMVAAGSHPEMVVRCGKRRSA